MGFLLKSEFYAEKIIANAGSFALAIILFFGIYEVKYPTILNKGIKPHLYCLDNIPKFREELVDFVADGDSQIKKDILLLQQELEFLGEYGSLVETSSVGYLKLEQRINEIEHTEYDNLIDQGYRFESITEVRSMIETAKALNMKYEI